MTATDPAQQQLATALRRVRARLLAELKEPRAHPTPRSRRSVWLVIVAVISLGTGWFWPHIVSEEGKTTARLAGTFFALACIVILALTHESARGAVVNEPAIEAAEPGDLADPIEGFTEASPLFQLRQRIALSDFECRLLLLCVACELDPAVPDLLRRLQDGALRQPTFALAQRLYPDAAWDSLSETRPLLQWLMLDARQQDGRPLAQSPLRIDDGLLHYLIGNPTPDARLQPYHVAFPPEADVAWLCPSQQDSVTTLLDALHGAAASPSLPVVQLTGPFRLAQQMTALAVIKATGAESAKLLRVPLAHLPADARDAEHLSRLFAREAILHGLALFVETDDASEQQLRTLSQRLFMAAHTLYFVASREAISGIPREMITLDVKRPLAVEQQHVWLRAGVACHPPLSDEDASCLADQFHLDAPAILNAFASTHELQFESSQDLRRHLQQSVRAGNRSMLDRLAQRIEPRATMDDLVIPAREKEQLGKYMRHIELRRFVFEHWGMGGSSERGRGTAALFAGESGTGKTLAAEVVAHALGLDLYRIDLSAVVDKYIGETEKNLRRIFDAAESGGVLLFFDEADALFGKRSEVKDSHDRYANIQINYLLQRLETYRGPTVLATNLSRSMDQAFMRRLRFIIRFPQPGRDERLAIWRKSLAPLDDDHLPDGRPVLALTAPDFQAIATHNLSGGEIRNAAIAAAFLAATAQKPLTRSFVEEAIRDEALKAGRPVTAGSNGMHS